MSISATPPPPPAFLASRDVAGVGGGRGQPGSGVGWTPTSGYQNDQRDVLNIRGVKILLQKKFLYPANGGPRAGWKVVVVVVVVTLFLLCMHVRILHRTLCILSINTLGEQKLDLPI